MSGIDLVVLIIILVSALVGLVRGFFREFVSFATWFVAVVVTLAFTSRFATLLPRDTIESPTARAAISAVALFLGCMLLGGLASWLLSKITGGTGLGLFDRIFGVGFGLARGAVIVGLLVLSANLVPTIKQETWWQSSRLLPPFQFVARHVHARLPREIAQHFDFASPAAS